jgi:hypothetical protein
MASHVELNGRYTRQLSGTATNATGGTAVVVSSGDLWGKPLKLNNKGLADLQFSFDGGGHWFTLTSADSFQWDKPVRAIWLQTAAGNADWEVLFGLTEVVHEANR